MKVLKIKLDKEREKVKYLDEKLATIEKHKDQIDANNAALNKTNMLLIEKMTKMDEQMDEVAGHARIVRINARNVEETSFAIPKVWLKPMPFRGKLRTAALPSYLWLERWWRK